MSRSVIRRAAVLFVLCVLLAAPWSAAAPRQDHQAPPQPLLGQLWNGLATLWSDIGCVIDPHGGCRGAAVTQGDIGCVIDPHGGCRGAAVPQGDIGCVADPHGCGR
jgi:hypothetical protein